MKTLLLAIPILIAFNSLAQIPNAQTGTTKPVRQIPKGSANVVVQRDANSRTWQRTTQERLPSGEMVPHVHTYTELATGMHYQKNGQWVESSEKIELVPTGGAAAVQGPHQVFFPYNIYDGVIETVTPDGEHLKSRPLGISYFDGSNNVLIAQLTNSIGLLISSNQVIYTNCFTDIAADLLCTYRRSGFECDLVFRSQPPAPEVFQMNPSETRLELLTEFFDTPEPEEMIGTEKRSPAERAKAGGSSPAELIDTDLRFGAMSMIHGKAFELNVSQDALQVPAPSTSSLNDGSQQSDSASSSSLPVAKTWAKLEGRTFLIEEVRAPEILPSLKKLPLAAAQTRAGISSARQLPPQRIVQNSTNQIQVASAMAVQPGVVLDYNIVNSQTNFTFKGDTTYYISGPVNLYGTNIIEGGAVIKYDTNYTCSINILGSVKCQTGPYRPAVFTTVNDSTTGEAITSPSAGCPQTYYLDLYNSTSEDLYFTVDIYEGNPDVIYVDNLLVHNSYYYGVESVTFPSYSGQILSMQAYDSTGAGVAGYYYTVGHDHGYFSVNYDGSVYYSEDGGALCIPPSASTGLSLANGGSLNDLVFRYLGTGIQSSGACSATNLQFVSCGNSAFDIANASLNAGNILISGSDKAFTGHGFTLSAQQLTCANGNYVVYSTSGTSSAAITNSLVTAVSSWGNVTIATNQAVKLGSSSGVFQTAGAGSFYLATNAFRNVGTTNIDPGVLAQIRQKTTYPPTIFTSTNITNSSEFGLNVARDTDTPDLGYHYAPLDYCFGNVTAKSNLTFDPGVAIGYFETASSANSFGLALANQVTNTFNGLATAPCTFARYDTVQEGGNGNWTSKGTLAGISTTNNSSYSAQINASFTHFYAMASDPRHLRDNSAQLNLNASHSEFHSGGLDGAWLGLTLTNCLFDRVSAVGSNPKSAGLYLRNCTMLGGTILAIHSGAGNTNWPVWIEDCAFDGTTTNMNDFSSGNTNITYCAYNALLNGAKRLVVTNTHDLVVSNFTWQPGPLGNFYQTSISALINTGSVTADLLGLYHFTTQTNQVKETNSVVDIGYHYLALDSLGNPYDMDGDGIPDYLEDVNGNGFYNSGDLADWRNPDTDNDGLTDGYEVSHGSIPAVADIVQLGLWKFDNTFTWQGENGQYPITALNVSGVTSWDTNAVRIDSNSPSVISYRDVELTGTPNIRVQNGSVRFWFKPDWSSTNASGNGPGVDGRFIELGAKGTTNGWWSLAIDSRGTNLYFGTQTNSSSTLMTNVGGAISWTSNIWHQLVVTYSPSNSSLYIDGQPVATNGSGVSVYPGASARGQGFSVGSSAAGTNQARGAFDDLETFNCPLSASTISSNYNAVTHFDRDGNGLFDVWEMNHFGHLGVDPNADPDGDGISNVGEMAGGTDPLVFSNSRLAYWRFNDSPSWRDEQSLVPTLAQGLVPIPSWSGTAVKLDAHFNAVLSYPGVRTNGSQVLYRPSGSVRFWFKPTWNSSVDQGGDGPGDNVRLFEIGKKSEDALYGWLGLTVNIPGNRLDLRSQAGGIDSVNASAYSTFASNTWYQIVVTYRSNYCAIYINGENCTTNGVGLTNSPSPSLWQQGFNLGCTADALHQAGGSFEELETFNFPLTDATVLADYSAQVAVLAADGLPVTVADGMGLRLDAVDTDCDGLPDAWEIANGLNPKDPTDATPTMRSLYAGGGNVTGPSTSYFTAKSNIWNIAFVSNAGSAFGTSMLGAMARGTNSSGNSADTWNFASLGADFMQGISLTDANNTSTGVKFFAYLGPCTNEFFVHPSAYTNIHWREFTIFAVTNASGYVIPGGRTYPVSVSSTVYLMDAKRDIDFLTDGLNVNDFRLDFWYQQWTSNALAPYSDWSLINNPGGAYDGYYERIWTDGDSITYHDYVYRVPTSMYLGWWYYPALEANNCSAWPLFGLPYRYRFYTDDDHNLNGLYYSLSPQTASDVSSAFAETTAYARTLGAFLYSSNFYSAGSGFSPAGCANCFLQPFESISHSSSVLAGNDGAAWRFSGDSGRLSTNVAGGWLKTYYPSTKRNVVVEGMPSGTYKVIVYFDSPSGIPKATINGIVPGVTQTANGTKYWYATVEPSAFNSITNFYSGIRAEAPISVITGQGTNGCIKIQIDSTNVFDANADLKILGVQIVRESDASSLEARPGNGASYLNWSGNAAASGYQIYRSVGNTNSWALIGASSSKAFTDSNLTAGVTYYYQVTGTNVSGSLGVSSIAGAIPFQCLSPLPPRIDFVQTLKLPDDNGSYSLPFDCLMTNSDAFDPQGYPMTFKIQSVLSGSLLINGAPFGPGNNTISNGGSAVWTPSSNLTSTNAPALRVYVDDGVNRSTNTVDVIIQQHPILYLVSWGNNRSGQAGNGLLHVSESFDTVRTNFNVTNTPPFQMTGSNGYNLLFQAQNALDILPLDPRWSIMIDWSNHCETAKRVLDLDKVSSVNSWHDETWPGLNCAVTSEGGLWVWGQDEAYRFGQPLVVYSNYVYTWNSDTIPGPVVPFIMDAPSPTPYLNPSTHSPITGVVAAKNGFYIRTDGSLWSIGATDYEYGLIGRDPQHPTDLANWYDGRGQGILPNRIEIDGNSGSGITPGREITEIETGLNSGLARCKDGTFWWWGTLVDWGSSPCEGNVETYNSWVLVDQGYDPSWVPKRLTSVEIPGAAPIKQASVAVNHYVFLREDGSVQELGYIPSLDPYRPDWFGWGCGLTTLGDCYSIIPVAVSGLPRNIRQISAGWNFTAALTDTGEVWVWGHWNGQTVATPLKVGNLSDITKIVAGDQFLLALDRFGRIWGAGRNASGVFGYHEVGPNNNNTDDYYLNGLGSFYTNAVRVVGVENATDVFLGGGVYELEWTAFAIGTEVQGKPIGVMAVGRDRRVSLSWQKYSGASSYIIYRSVNRDEGYTPIGQATDIFYDDQPLSNGQTYYYEVSAVVNGVETARSWESQASPYQAPGPVTSLTAGWACNGVKLQWLAPTNVSSSPLDEYQVLVNGIWLADLTSSTTVYFDDTAVSGATNTYTLVAFNSAGAASNSISPTGTIPCDPAPYVNTNSAYHWLSVSSGGLTDSATLEWSGPTNAQQWLYQPSEFDVDPYTGNQSFNNVIDTLSGSGPNTPPRWIWNQLVGEGADTNSMLNYSAPVSTRIAALTAGLNQVLTNGQSVASVAVFSTSVDDWPYRPATANLFHTNPTGTNLVQLKRMLLDDGLYIYGAHFTRGGNWGTGLTGFRLHYRFVQYINGQRSERIFQRDVKLSDVKYDYAGINDGNNLYCGTYGYSWPIPAGALCWASVSAIVNGEESAISNEVGPQAANQVSYSWDSSLRAIPGNRQIYLDWKPETNAFSYDLYYSTNASDTNALALGIGTWQPVPGGTGLLLNRFWHTNLVVGTTNYYLIAANDYFMGGNPLVSSQTAFAVVTNAPTTNWFIANAAAYDSMVLVEWTVPTNQYTTNISLSQTNWQFFLERKNSGTADSTYQLLTEVGYGLAYLDSEVINGHSYTYRVTAFDQSFNRLQAVALARGSGSPTNSPSATNGLTLLPPQPGNAYVNLTWSPIRATQFVIKRSLSPDSLFETVGTVNVSDAYQTARNTYRDYGLQNGIMYYYQVVATTPTGYEIASDIKGAMPLSTLAPLPPTQFRAKPVQLNGTNTMQLSWTPVNGASLYQLFIQNNVTLLPLFNTAGATAAYVVPPEVGDHEILTFAVRSMNAQGVVSDVVMTSVTNQLTGDAPTPVSPVLLKIDGIITNAMTVVGPTNLTLSADVNLPYVTQVSFYSDGQLIGTADSTPFQFVWTHVPGGPHNVTAAAYIQSLSIGYAENISTEFSSAACALKVNVEPQLSAYQTSATDLQLPAPALPIVLSRLYNSRNTDTNAILGVGWTPGWSVGSVQFSTNLANGWSALSQPGFAGQNSYFISDTAGHYVTVTLPGGQSAMFGAQLDYESSDLDGQPLILNSDYIDPPQVQVSFSPLEVNSGTFSTSQTNLTIQNLVEGNAWTGDLTFNSQVQTGIAYESPDGSVFQFDRPLITNSSSNLEWLLTKQIDRNGNSLTYNYNSDNSIKSISNSCGRSVTFAYSSPQTGITNISVTDMLGGSPSVVYVVSNQFLTEVRQLVDRSGPTYQTNRYVYGPSGHPADANRITDVYDARAIRVLHNTYTNSNGDLAVQISPGRTNLFFFDTNSYNLTVTSVSSSGTNTALVKSDLSGAISGATTPVSGTNAANSLAAQVAYDSSGNVISQTDANGNTKTYGYDSLNRPIAQSDENGNTSSTELNTHGQPTISTDAKGNQTLYEYDGNGNPTNVRDPSGTSTSYRYTSPVGNSTAYLGAMQTSQSQAAPFVPYRIVSLNTYQTTGSVLGDLLTTTEEWQDGGGTVHGVPVSTSYQYDANGNRTAEIKQRTVTGGTQFITNSYTYDALDRVTKTIISASGAETLAPQTNLVFYNALGKQAYTVDVANRTNTSTYDFNGNLIESKSPDGTVTRTSYDGFGRQQYVQDRAMPDGSDVTTAPATLSWYDASGRVTNSVRLSSVTLTKTAAATNVDFVCLGTVNAFKMVASSPGTNVSSNLTFYDAVGRVQFTVDAHNAVTENRYDAAGRRINTLVYTQTPFSGTLPPGGAVQSTTYTYDANGNQVSVTDAAGHTTTSIYDGANRVIETRYPVNNGTVSRFTSYDGLGRKIWEADEAGVATTCIYDFRGLLTSVTLASGTPQSVTTTYDYDELGNEIKQTDAAGRSTTNRFDALGRRVGRILPGAQSESYVYDLTGNLVYQTNFNGVVITNYYDPTNNRLTSRLSAGNYKVSYAYNPTNGLRTSMTDVTGLTSYQYDGLNRLTQKTVAWTNGPTVSLNYGYDATGLLTSLGSSTSGGVTNVYQYDLLGRLTNVLANGSAAATYGFDPVGNLRTMRFGSGVTNLYQYDSRNRLTNLVWKLNSTALASFGYTVGSTGNRTALAESLNGSRTYGWTYDLLYRMTGETMSGIGSVNYQFDPVGNRTNRTSSVSGLNNQAFIYNKNDWLTNTDTYDSNGNTTASAGTAYQYDVLNHLTNANSGAVVIDYDGDGNRVKKTVSGTTTYFLLDDRNPSGYVQVVEEYQGSTLTALYNFGLDLISQKQSGTIRYFGYDGHGSTRFLTDTSGTVTDTYAYDAYGNKITSASTGSSVNKYLYCGEQFDSDLNQYYLRARYYKPDTGRFWTMDPYEGNSQDPLSLHEYLYCQNNPINGYDPTGHGIEFDDGKGQQAHWLFFDYCVEQGIPKYFDTTVSSVYPGNASDLRPDVMKVSGKLKGFYELKPVSHETSIPLQAEDRVQLGNYDEALKGALSRGDQFALVPSDGISLGAIVDPADNTPYEMLIKPSRLQNGLIYYWFRKIKDEDEDWWWFFVIPTRASAGANSAASAVRLVAGRAAIGARSAAAAAEVGVETRVAIQALSPL